MALHRFVSARLSQAVKNPAIIATIVLTACLLLGPTSNATESRVALVIGNGAYADAPLRNPVNDARAMAEVLRELNFDVVLLQNADRYAMQRGMLEFGRKLTPSTVGLFYFAGHGMQVRGANYIIPIGAQPTSEDEVEVEAVDVNYILARMATAKNQFNVVILDACRNNPFERSFRSGSSGLAAISAPRGTLIAYATAPGSLAADGAGDNGLYTGELVSALKMPNLTLEQTFKKARAEVVVLSKGRQTPWESSSVIGDFVFRPQAKAPALDSAEGAFWNTIKDSTSPSDYQAYLNAYPRGVFAALATERIKGLTDARTAETDRVAREAVDKKAREALERMKLEEDKARASEGAKVASLGAPGGSRQGSISQDYIKNHWPEIAALLKSHFMEPDNIWFYRLRLLTYNFHDRKIDKVSLQKIEQAFESGIDVVVLLQGQYLGWNSSQIGFSFYVKYNLELVENKVAISGYSFVPYSEVVSKPESDGFGRNAP